MTAATVESCLTEATARLKSAGIAQPQREARLLLAHASGADEAKIIGYPEHPVADRTGFLSLIEERARGRPMAQLLGRREFWSLDFDVTPDTLDPRPDSETLVEAALSAVPDKQAAVSVLDLGTGTGCLLLALLSELPNAWGVGVDCDAAAAAVARRNAARLDLADRARIVVGDWAAALHGAFDLLLVNPPYIPSGDIRDLQVEVARYEPPLALDGGRDGLDSYRALAPQVKRLLAPSGTALIEVGHDQWEPVAGLFEAAELDARDAAHDLSGVRRCVICRHRFGR
ncbi:MAG: peptide chain release factor N(5)-glutamine methyltransferase [Alphaproteobacteria bacterium]|nr:peptide chain release factor N(5)-glutamine methyltransferase [Alphaproteobacteria bacterium]